MEWLRWYHGTISDPKWRVVAADTGQPIAVVVAVWAAILEHGSNADERGPNARERGSMFGWNERVVGAALDLPAETVRAIVDAMQGLVLDGDSIRSWEKRQVKREDSSAERARAWRERKRTEANASERTRTPDKTREEKKVSPPTPQGDGANGVKTSADLLGAAEPEPSKRATRLPDGWQPSADLLAWAKRDHPRVNLQNETAKFGDYWRGKGANATKTDWGATWRNWIRTAGERLGDAPPTAAKPGVGEHRIRGGERVVV